jgi:hypothetical protein
MGLFDKLFGGGQPKKERTAYNDLKANAEVARLVETILPLVSDHNGYQRYVKAFGAAKAGNEYLRVIVSRFCFLEWAALTLHSGNTTEKAETLLLAFVSAFCALPFAEEPILIDELYPLGLERDLVVATMRLEGESINIRYKLASLIIRAVANRNGNYVEVLRGTKDLSVTLFTIGNTIRSQIHAVPITAPVADFATLGEYHRCLSADWQAVEALPLAPR